MLDLRQPAVLGNSKISNCCYADVEDDFDTESRIYCRDICLTESTATMFHLTIFCSVV